MYITQQSCHPDHIFTGFIHGELTRYKRLSFNSNYFRKIKSLFFYRLLARGYNIHFLEKIFKKSVWSSQQPNNSSTVPKKHIIPFVIRYSTRKHLKKLSKLLHPFKYSLGKWLPNSEFLTVFSKSRTLGSYITSSGLKLHHKNLLKRKSSSSSPLGKSKKLALD